MKPRVAHMRVEYEHISHGKFIPTAEGAGNLLSENVDAIKHSVANKTRFILSRDDQRNPQLTVAIEVRVPVGSVEEAARLANADWAPTNLPQPEAMLASIPGRMHATYLDGEIRKVWFSPAAGHPGYQGGSFIIEEHEESYPDEEDDRPFWGAMEAYLAVNNPEWEG